MCACTTTDFVHLLLVAFALWRVALDFKGQLLLPLLYDLLVPVALLPPASTILMVTLLLQRGSVK